MEGGQDGNVIDFLLESARVENRGPDVLVGTPGD